MFYGIDWPELFRQWEDVMNLSLSFTVCTNGDFTIAWPGCTLLVYKCDPAQTFMSHRHDFHSNSMKRTLITCVGCWISPFEFFYLDTCSAHAFVSFSLQVYRHRVYTRQKCDFVVFCVDYYIHWWVYPLKMWFCQVFRLWYSFVIMFIYYLSEILGGHSLTMAKILSQWQKSDSEECG